MVNTIYNILAARDGDWIQLAIFVVIFAVAIIKKIISGIKKYSQEQSEFEEQQQEESTPSARRGNYVYERDAFKTIEQIRDEKIAKIRAAYGIPEPQKQIEPEPITEPYLEEPPVREQMFEPPPIRQRPPVYKPMIKKAVEPAPAIRKAEPLQKRASKHPEPEKEKQRDMLVRLSSPQDLRTAILYQEILGKPLALRDE